MIDEKALDEMKDTEEKQLLKILKDGGKPFVRKHDGIAVKMDEDKQIEYKDWEDNERTLKVPAGSYVVCNSDGCCPKIVTAEDFEKKNKFMEESKKKEKPEKKEDNSPKIGIESVDY
jgi:hypothetical protein